MKEKKEQGENINPCKVIQDQPGRRKVEHQRSQGQKLASSGKPRHDECKKTRLKKCAKKNKKPQTEKGFPNILNLPRKEVHPLGKDTDQFHVNKMDDVSREGRESRGG